MEEEKNTGYRKELYTEDAKRKRFVRIAEARTNRALDAIRLLGNTSNKTLYSYTEDDIEKIFVTLENRLTEVKGKFKTGKSEQKFHL